MSMRSAGGRSAWGVGLVLCAVLAWSCGGAGEREETATQDTAGGAVERETEATAERDVGTEDEVGSESETSGRATGAEGTGGPAVAAPPETAGAGATAQQDTPKLRTMPPGETPTMTPVVVYFKEEPDEADLDWLRENGFLVQHVSGRAVSGRFGHDPPPEFIDDPRLDRVVPLARPPESRR